MLSVMAAAVTSLNIPRSAHAQSVPVPAPASARAPESITVDSRPIPAFDPKDPSRTRFGSLQYRSGLILSSSHRDFGGISALHLDAKGEGFVALSDKANWLTGKITYRGDAMAGLSDVEIAPILGADGKPLASRNWYDTESLAFDGATAYVGIERVHQIVKFDFGRDGVQAKGQPIPQPLGMRKLPSNGSLESLVFVRKETFKTSPMAGMLLAISERGLDAAGNILAWIIGCSPPAICCSWSESSRCSATPASASAACRCRRWRRTRWSMVRRSSRRISAMRSTISRASTAMSRPRAIR
jgi:hypothetical protein